MQVGNTVTVRLAQQSDSIGARVASRACSLLDHLIDLALNASVIVGLWRRVGFGDEHVAIRQRVQPSRMAQPPGECIYRYASRGVGFFIALPPFGRSDVDAREKRLLRRR